MINFHRLGGRGGVVLQYKKVGGASQKHQKEPLRVLRACSLGMT